VLHGRLGLDVRGDLLHRLVVVLQIAVLEEDQVVVFVRLDAVLAESVGALVARSFDFFSLVARLFAVRDAVVSGLGASTQH